MTTTTEKHQKGEIGVNMYYTQMLMKLRCIDVQSGVDDNDDDDDDDVDVDDGIGKDIYQKAGWMEKLFFFWDAIFCEER